MRWIFLSITLIACGETSGFWKSTVTPTGSAEQNYQYGLRELKDSNYQLAEQYFRYVKSNFGYSRWAIPSDLGLCDVDFGREKYIEAIEGYRQFIKLHPKNERVIDGYVEFRIAESYYKQIPSDWFMSPPAYEKDQGPVLDAERELGTFVEAHRDSAYYTRAKDLLSETIRRLTDHELFVARYYLDHDRPLAAIGRLEGIVQEYPFAKREPETLLLLGKTYLKMKKNEEAKRTFEKLQADHPDDFRAVKARLYLDYIAKQAHKS